MFQDCNCMQGFVGVWCSPCRAAAARPQRGTSVKKVKGTKKVIRQLKPPAAASPPCQRPVVSVSSAVSHHRHLKNRPCLLKSAPSGSGRGFSGSGARLGIVNKSGLIRVCTDLHVLAISVFGRRNNHPPRFLVVSSVLPSSVPHLVSYLLFCRHVVRRSHAATEGGFLVIAFWILAFVWRLPPRSPELPFRNS